MFNIGAKIFSYVKIFKKESKMESNRTVIDLSKISERAIDSHAHLSELKNLDEIISNLEKDRLSAVINMVGSVEQIDKARGLSKEFPNIYYMVGLHPYDIEKFDDEFVRTLKFLRETDDHFVGVGEIGLDYHGEYLDKNLQIDVFEKQIVLADSLGLPISLHIRDAHEDCKKVLLKNKKYVNNGGIIHCFSGSVEDAEFYLSLGFYLSISGTITFKKKNASKTELEKVVEICPMDRLLIETDSPFLCPAPFRGHINEPRFVLETAKAVADIKCKNVNDLIKQTRENTQNLLLKKI